VKRVSAVLLAVLLLSGCATIPTSIDTGPKTKIFKASKNHVWELLVNNIGIEYPVEAIEKDSGFLATSFVSLPAGFANKKMGEWVIWPQCFLCTFNGLRLKINIVVLSIDETSTKVTVKSHYEAFENNVSKSWQIVYSNGYIERKIFQDIENSIYVD
jgi:hypothetical protein